MAVLPILCYDQPLKRAFGAHAAAVRRARLSLVPNSPADVFGGLHPYLTDQPKHLSAQQARHKRIRFAFGAASARLRPAS